MGTLKNETTQTQLAIIRKHLLTYGEIDKKTALRICDCDRLGARIYELRRDKKAPLDIVTVRETKRNRFGRHTTYAKYVLRREG